MSALCFCDKLGIVEAVMKLAVTESNHDAGGGSSGSNGDFIDDNDGHDEDDTAK